MRVAVVLASIAHVALAAASAHAQVHFQRDVAPLLVKRCIACHGEQKHEGGFRLHTFAALLQPGDSGDASITPGQPDASHLLALLGEDDPDVRMPKKADKLPVAEIDLIRRWIAEGAKLEGAEPTATLVNLAHWPSPDPPETYRLPLPITALAFRPDGQELAVGGLHEVTIWSVADGALVRRLKGLAERTYGLAYNKDGTQLAVACGTPGQWGEVKLISAADGALVRHFGSQLDCAFGVAWSPDAARLAVCGADQTVRVFAVESGKEEVTIKDHSDWVLAVAWSPDGARLTTASRDKTCKVFDAKTGGLVTTFAEHGDAVHAVAYHGDGKHALSCGGDSRIRYWLADDPGWENEQTMDRKKRHQVGESGGFSGAVHRLVVGDGQVFACGVDPAVRQFNLENRGQQRVFQGHQDWISAIEYHAGSKLLATGSLNGQVRIWQTDAPDEQQLLRLAFFAAPGYVAAAATP